MWLVYQLIAMTVMGVLSFVIGEKLPNDIFDHKKFPFRAFKWENDGRVYEKLKIKKWKDILPDMSRIFSKMLRKKAAGKSKKEIGAFIIETCRAEAVHAALALAGFVVLTIIGGVMGFVISLLYAAGNLVFVIIQRYNRPRLVKIYDKMEMLEKRKQNG